MLTRSCIALMLLGSAALAETRTFTVYVDKKECGAHTIVVNDRDDGTRLVTSQAEVTVKVALFTYRYAFQSTETWKGDKLVQFSSSTNDNGKKHTVAVVAAGDSLQLTADGKAAKLSGTSYTITNYWTTPKVILKGPGAISLIDADTGKRIDAEIKYVGVEKVSFKGNPIDCHHYRIRDGVEVDLWFDGSDRLVRQESIEEGHRTVLELTNYQKD